MSGTAMVIAEITLTLLVCVGFGLQQLWSLRRMKKRDEAAERAKEAEKAGG